jgi:alkyl sulfatase BDS1-like metallo-beta-lactamase superfamily hydrolase
MKSHYLKCSLFACIFAAASVNGAPALNEPKPASAATLAAQAKVLASLPKDDGQDEAFARRGFIATLKDKKIRNKDGKLVWDVGQFDWVQGDAPATVNPSLWRQNKLLGIHGLFKITDGVWQVRGFDPGNMLIISGETGWIIVDPLMSTQTAAAALKLVNDNLGKRPVSAILYGHNHADHYGGVRAVVTPGTNPTIYAPEHFISTLSAESVIAGSAMARRAAYQFGITLKPGEQGYAGSGIVGGPVTNDGTISLLLPTDDIKNTGETRIIDGVKFEFQMVPDTEAPAEMNFYLPEKETLYVSENTTCTMHNLQTPRGALVRDALSWASYTTEQLDLWGDKVEWLVTGHCWPHFGNAAIRNYLELQRDNYKFLHDQTVRRFNNGETPTEIAENLKRPKPLEDEWSNKGYYGTVKHNVKGIFQRYIGWWDGIPAHLDQLPTAELSSNYVRAMGGAKGVLKEAKDAMDRGEYRWSAQILNDLVFADPENTMAKALLADSYEQLAYQAESAIWRNIYLVGAGELRGDIVPSHMALQSADVVGAMSMESFLSMVASRLNPDKIGDRKMTLMIDDGVATDKSLVTLRNAVLIPEVGKSIPSPTVAVSGSRTQLIGLFVGKLPLDKLETAGLKIEGDRDALVALMAAIDSPQQDFPIVTP